MFENKKYRVVKMHICKFENNNGKVFYNLNECPTRLCILDKENMRVIDVETMHQYPYLSIYNMKYYVLENNINIESKRYACVEYDNLIYMDLDSKTLNKCHNIIKLLDQGFNFLDGNNELNDSEYLAMVNDRKNTKKKRKIMEKRK